MPKKNESLEQVEPVSYEGKYICLNGMNYADIRRERGDIVDDIPADSLEWLLEWGHVEPYTGQVLGEPPAIPHVERRVRKPDTEAPVDAEEFAFVDAKEAVLLADHSVDANKMVELVEAEDDDIFETSDRVTEDDPVYDKGVQVIPPSSQQPELAEAGYPVVVPFEQADPVAEESPVDDQQSEVE